jgi:hypothetical protein
MKQIKTRSRRVETELFFESRSTPFAYAPFTPVPILMNDMWHLKILMGEIKPQYRFNILWLLSFPLLSLHSIQQSATDGHHHAKAPPPLFILLVSSSQILRF